MTATLRPGAVESALGVPASELAGRAVALDDLWPGVGAALIERVVEAPDDRARAALLQQALATRVRDDDADRRRAMRAVRAIARGGGRRSTREIAAAIGVGQRRLQQIFRAQVGLSPRMFGRLARAHEVLRALRDRRRPEWARLAAEVGFYDQAHLVNELRALFGVTPAALFRRTASRSSKTRG